MPKEEIKLENAPHLKVLEVGSGKSAEKELFLHQGKSGDNIKVTYYEGDKKIIYFELVPYGASSERQSDIYAATLLYSRTHESHIITMGRYPFSFPIELYSWMIMACPNEISDDVVEEIKTLGSIEMVNAGIPRDGNLSPAIREHERRINGLNLEIILLEEAVNLYYLIANNISKD